MKGFGDREYNNSSHITNASHSWLDFKKIKDGCTDVGVEKVVGEMGGRCIFIHVLKLSFFRKKTIKVVVF